MQSFDFLIPQRPLSVQMSSRKNYQTWKDLVRDEARRSWAGPLLPAAKPRSSAGGVRLTVVFLCKDSSIDVDNVIKPIQDALIGLVYADDRLVTDVDSHRRYLSEPLNLAHLPPLLSRAALASRECVYVRVEPMLPLEEYLWTRSSTPKS